MCLYSSTLKAVISLWSIFNWKGFYGIENIYILFVSVCLTFGEHCICMTKTAVGSQSLIALYCFKALRYK